MNLRQYEIVTNADKLSVDIQETCMRYKTIKQWAYIMHDKDDTRPHYHIYVNFGTSVKSELVAEWFQVPENFIGKVRGRKADMLLYLTHANDGQNYKHIYEQSEVVSNFDVQLEIEKAKIIGDFEHRSYAQQLAYVEGLPIDEKIVAFNKLKKLWELYCQTLTLDSHRNLDVLFICGKGGTGKTYYAKKMLESMEYDYCVSSSSNDAFQDYMGQKAIILDDLRDTAFELEDLLKILDNNTSSSVKSRFNNKVFNGQIIVITTPIPLRYWYSSKRYDNNGLDSLIQLYRRIGTYIEVTENEIKVFGDGMSNDGRPNGIGIVYQNELCKLKETKIAKTDFVSVFDKICKNAQVDVFSDLVAVEPESTKKRCFNNRKLHRLHEMIPVRAVDVVCGCGQIKNKR